MVSPTFLDFSFDKIRPNSRHSRIAFVVKLNPMTSDSKPLVYLLYGDDPYAMAKYVEAMLAKLGDKTTAEMNTARFSGYNANENDLRTATGSMPFLAERRIVVWEHPIPTPDEERSMKKEARERLHTKLLGLLSGMPETTALVLLIEDERAWRGGQTAWRQMNDHWLMVWAHDPANRGKAYLKEFALPSPQQMPAWIIERAKKEKGPAGEAGLILPQAALALSERVGNDTRIAASEITKLLTYVNFKRPVEVEDVQQLTPQVDHEDIFALVDAMGRRDRALALKVFHHLLEDQDWLALFGMIVRQFRLLLLVREVMEAGGSPVQVIEQLRGEPFRVTSKFAADKLYQQARAFSLSGLEDIYRRLLALDEAIKTGQSDPVLAFDTFMSTIGE